MTMPENAPDNMNSTKHVMSVSNADMTRQQHGSQGTDRNGWSDFALVLGIVVAAAVEVVLCLDAMLKSMHGDADILTELIVLPCVLLLLEAGFAAFACFRIEPEPLSIAAPIASLVCGTCLLYVMWKLLLMGAAVSLVSVLFLWIFAIFLLPFIIGVYGIAIYAMWLLGTVWGLLYVISLFRRRRLGLIGTAVATIVMFVPIVNLVEVPVLAYLAHRKQKPSKAQTAA